MLHTFPAIKNLVCCLVARSQYICVSWTDLESKQSEQVAHSVSLPSVSFAFTVVGDAANEDQNLLSFHFI